MPLNSLKQMCYLKIKVALQREVKTAEDTALHSQLIYCTVINSGNKQTKKMLTF